MTEALDIDEGRKAIFANHECDTGRKCYIISGTKVKYPEIDSEQKEEVNPPPAYLRCNPPLSRRAAP